MILDVLQRVPWKLLKDSIDWVRRLRPIGWPEDEPTINLEMSHDRLEAKLRACHFEGTKYSLKCKGEVVNLRRPCGVRESEDDVGEDYYSEVHLKTRDHPYLLGVIQVVAHWEWSRYEEKTGHVSKNDVEWLDEDWLWMLLEGCRIDVDRVEARQGNVNKQ